MSKESAGAAEPFSDKIPTFFRHGPITLPRFDRHPWWRRRWRRSRRIRANLRWLFSRRLTSAILIINVRWGLSG